MKKKNVARARRPAPRIPPAPAPPDEEGPFYIVAPAVVEAGETLVLKHGESFAVFNALGDIRPVGRGEEGLYHAGTRFLSGLQLSIGGQQPLFLSSTVKQDNGMLAVDLTNPDFMAQGGEHVELARGTLHVFRSKFLWQDACYERLRIRNYGLHWVKTVLSLQFQADYADIFEVRGTPRAARGRKQRPQLDGDTVRLGYQGLDEELRCTRLKFDPPPRAISATQASFALELGPEAETTIFVSIYCETGAGLAHRPCYENASQLLAAAFRASREQAARLETSNERFNDWLQRSVADLHMMITQTPYGPYPYAGVPWFSTAFGRDGLLTAIEYLAWDPSLARGVLAYLAATQARELQPARDAEPGKILHETRGGEMAALGEVPFARYYGSVDATPLFVLLAAEYYERTADLEFLRSIWPNVDLALQWIDRYGDADGDGFVEYARHTDKGLVQQGWKDSADSVFHADGSPAPAPIALCEVQAYVYAAKRGAAQLAAALGQPERAVQLTHQAEVLQGRFERVFWCEELGTYALALDGEKRPCQVRTSNAGHCLFAGIASPERASRVARTLLADESFSGWGIRTVAAAQPRYNPMSYHNGSVWPHDNAIAAAGLARYGLISEVARVLGGMFDASQFVRLRRMPELFCGFPRRPDEGPTLYPVACAPQAWAAASVFLFLQSSLGIRIDAPARQIRFTLPSLPECIREVRLVNLRVRDATIDLVAQRHGRNAAINVLRREGDLEVVVVK